jgi:phage terminase large subunit-like protein
MIDLKPLAAPPSPREASWLGPFRHELMAFPNGRHDDLVDSVAQFLDWMSLRV